MEEGGGGGGLKRESGAGVVSRLPPRHLYLLPTRDDEGPFFFDFSSVTWLPLLSHNTDVECLQ